MSPLANYGAQGGLYRLAYWLFYLTILITLKGKKLQDDNLVQRFTKWIIAFSLNPEQTGLTCLLLIMVNSDQTSLVETFGSLQGLSSPEEPLLPLCFRTWIS